MKFQVIPGEGAKPGAKSFGWFAKVCLRVKYSTKSNHKMHVKNYETTCFDEWSKLAWQMERKKYREIYSLVTLCGLYFLCFIKFYFALHDGRKEGLEREDHQVPHRER